jgi:hypothetical protein
MSLDASYHLTERENEIYKDDSNPEFSQLCLFLHINFRWLKALWRIYNVAVSHKRQKRYDHILECNPENTLHKLGSTLYNIDTQQLPSLLWIFLGIHQHEWYNPFTCAQAEETFKTVKSQIVFSLLTDLVRPLHFVNTLAAILHVHSGLVLIY